MTTTTDVIEVDYTWETADFDWLSDTAATTTLATASIDSFTLSAGLDLEVGELKAKSCVKAPADSIITQEITSKIVTGNWVDVLALLDIYIDNVNAILQIDYHLITSEIHGNVHPDFEAPPELISALDTASRNATKSPTQAVLVQDAMNVAAVLAATELTTLAESISQRFSTGFEEATALNEAFNRLFQILPIETISLTETFIDLTSFIFAISESITVDEVGGRGFNPSIIAELLTASDYSTRGIQLQPIAEVNVAELVGRVVHFARLHDEPITLEEAVVKAVSIPPQEAAALSDLFIKNLEGVIEELRIAGDVASLEALLAMMEDSPANFSSFETYLPGEYTFKKALINTQLRASGTDSTPSINKIRVTSDLPDREERGSVEVIAGNEAVITFDKEYYYKPEVSLTLLSGTELGVPRVYSATTTGFTIRVTNAAAQLIGGLVSWKATGA